MVQNGQCDDAQPEERSQRVRQVLQDFLQRRAAGESLSDQSISTPTPS